VLIVNDEDEVVLPAVAAILDGLMANTPHFTFRTAVASDALCLGVLATQVFLDTYAVDGIRPSVAREALEHFSTDAIATLLADSPITFLVAESAGHMIAFAQMTFGSAHELVAAESTVELNRLYVLERFSGKGIGAALLRRAEALAAAQGASTLWLSAWAENHRALGFYTRQGYEDVGASLYVYEGEEYETRVFVRALGGGAVPSVARSHQE